MPDKSLNRSRSFIKATLYILLYAVMMLMLLKLIADSKAMNTISIEDEIKTEYLFNDERKIIP